MEAQAFFTAGNSSHNTSGMEDRSDEEENVDPTAWWQDETLEHTNGPVATGFILFFYVCIQIISLFGNALVLVIVAKHKKMRTITNFFLANLAVADLMVAVFCMPYLLMMIVLEHWPLGEALCKTYGFVRSMSQCASTTILLLLATERFLAIVHPFSGRKYLMSRTTLLRSAVAVWIVSAIVSTPNIYFFRTYTHEFSGMGIPDMNQTICYRDYSPSHAQLQLSYDVVYLVLFYVLPCVVTITLYYIVGVKLWRSSNDSSLGFSDSGRHERTHGSFLQSAHVHVEMVALCTPPTTTPESHVSSTPKLQVSLSSDPFNRVSLIQNRKKVIRMLIVIVVLFIVCWLPAHIRKFTILYRGWTGGDGFSWLGSTLLPLSDWLINVNSAVNPLIYALFSENFRAAAAQTLRGRIPSSPFSRGSRSWPRASV